MPITITLSDAEQELILKLLSRLGDYMGNEGCNDLDQEYIRIARDIGLSLNDFYGPESLSDFHLVHYIQRIIENNNHDVVLGDE